MCLPSHCTRNFHLKDKRFVGSLNSYIRSEGAICKTIRYRTALLIWFACSKVSYVGIGVSVLSQGVFILSNAKECLNICSAAAKLQSIWNRISKSGSGLYTLYLSNKITKCVTYLSRNSLSTHSNSHHSDTYPEKITASGL